MDLMRDPSLALTLASSRTAELHAEAAESRLAGSRRSRPAGSRSRLQPRIVDRVVTLVRAAGPLSGPLMSYLGWRDRRGTDLPQVGSTTGGK
jgi:hypothetical protein